MKIIIISSILLLVQLVQPIKAQEYYSNLYFFSEISPTFPTDKNRYLINPHQNLSMEWRNRIGIRTFGSLFVGINSTIRTYQQLEKANYNNVGRSNIYGYQLNNTLWGLGPFATKLFEISDKWYFSASIIANLEQGKGKFIIDNDISCNACLENAESFIPTNQPNIIIARNLREITLSANAELGIGYIIHPKFALYIGFNVSRYERFRTSTGRIITNEFIAHEADRDLNVGKREFSTILQRPNFNIGIIGAFGRERF